MGGGGGVRVQIVVRVILPFRQCFFKPRLRRNGEGLSVLKVLHQPNIDMSVTPDQKIVSTARAGDYVMPIR